MQIDISKPVFKKKSQEPVNRNDMESRPISSEAAQHKAHFAHLKGVLKVIKLCFWSLNNIYLKSLRC